MLKAAKITIPQRPSKTNLLIIFFLFIFRLVSCFQIVLNNNIILSHQQQSSFSHFNIVVMFVMNIMLIEWDIHILPFFFLINTNKLHFILYKYFCFIHLYPYYITSFECKNIQVLFAKITF